MHSFWSCNSLKTPVTEKGARRLPLYDVRSFERLSCVRDGDALLAPGLSAPTRLHRQCALHDYISGAADSRSRRDTKWALASVKKRSRPSPPLPWLPPTCTPVGPHCAPAHTHHVSEQLLHIKQAES